MKRVAAIALVLLSLFCVAACRSAPRARQAPQAVEMRVYELGELIDVLDEDGGSFSITPIKSVGVYIWPEQLAADIVKVIGPGMDGRPFRVETRDAPPCLVVTAPRDVQERVGTYLASLRRAINRPRGGFWD